MTVGNIVSQAVAVNSNEYLDAHMTDENGVRWVKVEYANRFINESSRSPGCSGKPVDDYDLKLNELELITEDLEAAHLWLDDNGVPRFDADTEAEYSLVGRIMSYKGMVMEMATE